MAYMDQKRKAELAPAIRAVLAKHGIKGTIAVRHHSTLVVNITEGPLDFLGNYNAVAWTRNRTQPEHMRRWARDYLDVNGHWAKEHFTGECLECVTALLAAAHTGNFDKSDLQSDYVHVGWYVDINIGSYGKPYRYTGPKPHYRFDVASWSWKEGKRA